MPFFDNLMHCFWQVDLFDVIELGMTPSDIILIFSNQSHFTYIYNFSAQNKKKDITIPFLRK